MEIYAILKHSHTLLVTLFTLSFIIKTILLLGNNQASLASYRKKMMVPEMIVSLLFVIAGLWMFIEGNWYHTFNWFWLKIILVLAIIPMGVIAFKRRNKALAVIVSLLLLFIIGYAFAR